MCFITGFFLIIYAISRKNFRGIAIIKVIGNNE